MSVNKSWVFDHSSFNSQFNPNQMLPNRRNNFPPSGMMRDTNFQVQRFPEPFIRPPPPFLCGPFQARMNEMNHFLQNQSHFSAPSYQPFMLGPRIPSGPSVRQPYSGNVIHQTGQALRFPLQNSSSSHRHFVPWNNSSQTKQWDTNIQPAAQLTSHYPPPNLQRQLQGDTKVWTNKQNTSNSQAQNQKQMKSWMTDEIYQAMERRNVLRVEAKKAGTEEAWQEFRIQRNKVMSLVREAKARSNTHTGTKVRKFKEEELIKPRPFLCDTCDKAFMDEDELNYHTREHIKCKLEGCQFEAHPKVVFFHQKMQHDTGYAKAILKLTNPKEIERWRNERRSRFPTAANIKKRQEENAEKRDRGEVIEMKDFGKFKKRKVEHYPSSNQVQQTSRGNKHPNRNRKQKVRPCYRNNQMEEQTQIETDSDDDSHIQLLPFKGMQSAFTVELQADLGNMEVCDELNKPADNSRRISDTKKAIASCIFSGDKDKSTDGDTLFPELVTTQYNENAHSSPLPASVSNEIVNRIANDSDNDAPTVLPIVKSAENEIECTLDAEEKKTTDIKACDPQHNVKECELGQVQKKLAEIRPINYQLPSSKRNNLLEKLLSKEISHERNIVFQCVRYVVENDCFGVHSD